ncbi:MAG: outer-membrane lipoprotein carrier protein LolA [Pseudomonadales bacterium]|nr:outer-membrane lipoprotein carrier protein LolA [Pseudomonadales bacterium]
MPVRNYLRRLGGFCRSLGDPAVRSASLVLMLGIASLQAAPADPLLDADPVSADRQQLAQRLQVLDRYSATFTQAIAGNQGQILEQSTGYVRLLRPLFKWVVDDPYPQTILTEGDVLKVYDPDLEQLTVRPLAEALKDTPVSVLTRSEVVLGEDFLVFRMPVEEGELYVVAPRGEDSLYAEIRLTFSATSLTGLGILDHFGQYTEIRFVPDDNPQLSSADFHLDIPPDTDVIGG